jgi:hypothetical protein
MDTVDILVYIFIIVLLGVNIGLSSYSYTKLKKDKKEGWNNGFGWSKDSKTLANPTAKYFYVKPPVEDNDKDYGQKTYAGCSCVGHGVKNNNNMPFNDDSNLYAKTKYQGY